VKYRPCEAGRAVHIFDAANLKQMVFKNKKCQRFFLPRKNNFYAGLGLNFDYQGIARAAR
jgi:hypothetical protein